MPWNGAKEYAVSNILIVESKNDKIFMEALISQLNYDIKVDAPICINDYECLNGLSKESLTGALKELKAEIQKKDIQKVGVIIDIDNHTREERIDFVNDSINNVFHNEGKLLTTGTFLDIPIEDGESLKLACYFTNVDGKGELETVLKSIKAKDSIYADCLDSWKFCIENKGKKINQKEFDKFWISTYLKFDTCSKKEKGRSEKKCSMAGFDYIMTEKREIWDFSHPILDDLKIFLQLFGD